MKMKRFFAVVLSGCMALALLAGCGGTSSSTTTTTTTPAATTTTPAASTPAAPAASAPKTIDWPKQNITIICPFKAGGGMDLSTRLTAKYLEKYLGVTVTVNNVEGGNSWTGWTQVAQAKGDGYTLGFANYPAQVAGYLNPSAGIPFTYKDFASISNVVSDPNILVVSEKHSKITTAQEFMEYAKNNNVVLGTGGGAGCDDDVTIAKINDMLGLSIESGRNASTAESKAAMLGGHIDGVIANVSEYYSLVGSTGDDAIRILCIFSEERNDFLPDVPTWTECGYDQIIGGSDRGLVGPANLDADVKALLIDTMEQIAKDPEFLEDAKTQGMSIGIKTGADFEAFIADTEATMKSMLPLFGWA